MIDGSPAWCVISLHLMGESVFEIAEKLHVKPKWVVGVIDKWRIDNGHDQE